MLSHVFIGISDFDRAMAFYRPLLEQGLQLRLRFTDPARPWAGWQSPGQPRPLFLIGAPHDVLPHQRGNGQMTAFLAADRRTVDRCHALALANGGSDEGAPGLRPEYHENYYGAYFRDPDGNKLCVACHDAVTAAPVPSA